MIEDQPEAVMLFKWKFEQYRKDFPDLEIKSASNLVAAYKTLKNFKPNVIVLDLKLGPEPYINTLAHIPELSTHAPVIVLTGMTDNESLKSRAKKEGAVAFLDKTEIASKTVVGEVIKLYLSRKKH